MAGLIRLPSFARLEAPYLMMVVDASAVVEVLFQTERGLTIEERLFAPGETLHVPHLIDIEVAHVVRRAWLQGLVAEGRAEEALEDLAAWALIRYPHDLFLPRIWSLRHNVTAYDAAYIALAETLEVTLLTCDARLAASSAHNATIEIA
jgi:predicted nucleic acid-binding protein